MSHVTCIYDLFWWVGMITSKDKEEVDAKIEFMHPHSSRKTFCWPTAADTSYVPFDDILVMITAPKTRTGHTYAISSSDYDETMAVFNEHCS